jgi:hypothetical protein
MMSTGLLGLARQTGGDDHHIAAGQVRIVAGE